MNTTGGKSTGRVRTAAACSPARGAARVAWARLAWARFALAYALAAPPGTALPAQPVRILPLGDSITQSDSTHDSYRRPLWQKLRSAGFDVDFVGSLRGNHGGGPPHDDFDLDHEGHWGWRADEILAHAKDWATEHAPDIVLLHAGTNDLLQGESVGSTIHDLWTIIDELRAVNPEVAVLVAHLIPHSRDGPGVEELNAQIPVLAEAQTSTWSPVIAVDHWSGFDPALDTFDGIHPDASGEEKMAERWHEALSALPALRGPLVPEASAWRYRRGHGEASSPESAWRRSGFDDSSWLIGSAPFRYGGDGGDGGTELADMRDGYSCVFLRREFEVTDVEAIEKLRLLVDFDDGFVAWINGVEVASRNAPETIAHDAVASASHAAGAAESLVIGDPADLLEVGANVIAVQAFNSSLGSSDFYLDLELSRCRQVADTSFSVDRGFHDTAFAVEISSDTPGATIRYTTDSSLPTETHGSVYTAPIEISTTTVLRAAAFREGFEPTNVDTQTYIFLGDVIRQSDQAPEGAFWNTEMDPDVVDDPRYRAEILEALTAIPTLSVVAEPGDLFSPSGIHWGDNLEDRDLEVPCSVELIYPGGAFGGFQEGAGLRIQGGGGRWDEGTYDPKQSFAVKFQRQYGKAKLRYPFFESAPLNGESAAREFDRIILRAGHNKSWSGPGPGDREWVTYARDQWARDTHIAMSGLDSHGTFVHLYLNGLYWGLYNPVERPDHNFLAAYYGGDGEDYYVKKKKGGSQTGSSLRYREMQSVIESTSTPYDEIREYLDTANYIDFCLVLWSIGVADLQWYSGNRNDPPGPVRFWVWDAEDSWDPGGRASDGYRFFEESDVFGRIEDHPEFRLELADRIQRHCFHEGALTDARNVERWLTLNASIEKAIIGESARWGDQREHPPLNRDDHWYDARDMVAGFMEGNTAEMVDDLRARGYFPDLEPPRLSRHGGMVVPDHDLVLSNPNSGGTIHYTVDGSDPRILGSGDVRDTAREYTDPLHLIEATVVKARIRNDGEWSALAEAVFLTLEDRVKLRVTEIMYHPWVGEGLDDEDYEFLELKNVGADTLDLSGCRLCEGIDHAFPLGTRIDPGAFMVLVSDAEAFGARYPGVEVSGEYERHLANGGERLRLEDAEGTTILEVTYLDEAPWPEETDGSGHSLVPTNATPVGDPNAPWSWRQSTELFGSPGRDDGVTSEEAPFIHRPPRDLTVAVGEPAIFTVWALGVPLPRYRWQRDREEIPAADRWYHFIPAVTLDDSGTRFRCQVSNALGTVTSVEATLTVVSPPVSGDFVSGGSRWRYLEGTREASEPRNAWRDESFDDSEWLEGNAPFGYGDPPFGTHLPDMEDSYSTLYLRQRFELPAGRQVTALSLRADYDDGFVAWINGEEVLRVNVAAGTEAHDGLASDGHESGTRARFPLAGPYDYLREGPNVVAIQVFNVDRSSSDLKLDAELAFEAIDVPEEPPPRPFRRGDVNVDGSANLSDAVSILAFLFLGQAAPPCEKSADVDDDGVLDISDPIQLLRYLYIGGVTLPPPFPACGLDATDDALTCADFAGCPED